MRNYINLFAILSILISSCENREPIPTYTLSTGISPTEGGRITVLPFSQNYEEGDTVTLIPEPNEHWVFQKWEGDGSGNSTSLQIIMNSNKSVVGIFVKRDYPLNITIQGQGIVEERIITNPSGREYPHGTTVELTPKPKEGWEFEKWEGDLTGNESTKIIKVDKEKNVIVKFKRKDYPLNITIVGEGTVEERLITYPSLRQYPLGVVVELKPIPKKGWVFDSWEGDLTGTISPRNITMDNEKNIIVKFREELFTLRIDNYEGGAIKITPEKEFYKNGDVIQLEATPEQDKEFLGWSGDISDKKNVVSISITKNMVIKPSFSSIEDAIIDSKSYSIIFDRIFSASFKLQNMLPEPINQVNFKLLDADGRTIVSTSDNLEIKSEGSAGYNVNFSITPWWSTFNTYYTEWTFKYKDKNYIRKKRIGGD